MSDEERDVQRRETRNDIHEEVRRSFSEAKPRWWQLNAAQAVTAGSVIVGIVFWFSTDHNELAALSGRFDGLTSRIVSIDTQGTRFSQQTTALDHQIIIAHEQRLQKLEDVGTRLAVMQSVLDTMQKDIAELKARKP